MNDDVFEMIATLRARLDDVAEAAGALDCEAPGIAARLDKADDMLYEIQLDLEKLSRGEVIDSAENTSKSEGILTESTKESLKSAGRAGAEILRDGKEVVSELTGTVNDLKSAFSLKPKK